MPTTPAEDSAAIQDTAATRLWPVWVAAVLAARGGQETDDGSVPEPVKISLELAAIAAVTAAWSALRRRPGEGAQPPARLNEFDVRVAAQEITNKLGPKIWKASKAHVENQPRDTDTVFARQATYATSAQMMSEAQMALAGKLGLRYKVWVSRGDTRVRPLHRRLHGKITEIGKPFHRWPTGMSLGFPGDPSAPLDAIINCRCLLAFTARKADIIDVMAPGGLDRAFGIAASIEQEYLGDE